MLQRDMRDESVPNTSSNSRRYFQKVAVKVEQPVLRLVARHYEPTQNSHTLSIS